MTEQNSVPTIEQELLTDPAGASPVDYLQLLKPRVMSLVIFTGLTGMVLAPGDIHPFIAFAAILCISIGAGASGAINMWFDADIDRHMARTRARPIPMGRVTPNDALAFGGVLSVFAVVVMGLAVNLVAAALLAFTIFFYVVIYTMWLKRRTPQNIVIGGAAGAFPPMIGWAAVTGEVSWQSMLLFTIIFVWTPPHFWALSLYRSSEYARVNVPMMPVVAGEKSTRLQILLYAIVLAPLAVAPGILGMSGWLFTAASSLLGLVFVVLAAQVWRERTTDNVETKYRWAKRLFGFSILYLFLIFAFLWLDHLILSTAG